MGTGVFVIAQERHLRVPRSFIRNGHYRLSRLKAKYGPDVHMQTVVFSQQIAIFCCYRVAGVAEMIRLSAFFDVLKRSSLSRFPYALRLVIGRC
jgi:hypothetical protein